MSTLPGRRPTGGLSSCCLGYIVGSRWLATHREPAVPNEVSPPEPPAGPDADAWENPPLAPVDYGRLAQAQELRCLGRRKHLLLTHHPLQSSRGQALLWRIQPAPWRNYPRRRHPSRALIRGGVGPSIHGL